MLCENCKIREANVLYTEIIDGQKTEHHFCSQCAKEMDFGQYSNIFDRDFPFSKILSGLLGESSRNKEKEAYLQIVCPTCRTSYEDFIKTSMFGCPDCYEVFNLLINDKIKQIQGSLSHTGKKPVHNTEKILPQSRILEDASGSMHTEDALGDLRLELTRALAAEDYEKAASLRDEIREMEKGEK